MLRYRIEGSGPPLLLIHGWGITFTVWQRLAPLLNSSFRLIMIELPGVGGSQEIDLDLPYYSACAEAIEELRCSLEIPEWSILAYSSGTRAAEAYIQRYPQYVKRSVFLCPLYLNEICSLAVRLLGNTLTPQMLKHWLFSDWRLYSLLLVLGFNGRPNAYTRSWKSEIELQSHNVLVRSLCEFPGQGRMPFMVPSVPSLFVWGRTDPLVDRPRPLRANDVVIAANHSAPMLAAAGVAEVVVPFLSEGKIVAPTKRARRLFVNNKEFNLKQVEETNRMREKKLLRGKPLSNFARRRQEFLQRFERVKE